jgi:transcriptional regulator with XRE-family HTH domain
MRERLSNTSQSTDANPIREYRLLRRVTQSQLAHACDCHPSTISQIECGYIVPSLDVAFRIAGQTGITLERIARFCLQQPLNADAAVVVAFSARRKKKR